MAIRKPKWEAQRAGAYVPAADETLVAVEALAAMVAMFDSGDPTHAARVVAVHGLDHLRGQTVVAQAGFARVTQCLPEPGPQQRYSHEVVEMPRLQRRVLPVVGERQQLAGVYWKFRSAAKVSHRGDRGDRCGSRTALGVQRRQPRVVRVDSL